MISTCSINLREVADAFYLRENCNIELALYEHAKSIGIHKRYEGEYLQEGVNIGDLGTAGDFLYVYLVTNKGKEIWRNRRRRYNNQFIESYECIPWRELHRRFWLGILYDFESDLMYHGVSKCPALPLHEGHNFYDNGCVLCQGAGIIETV
jgi:hypothetical protein